MFFSSTSDSSIYYPKRRSRLDIQNILDEKAVHLFHSKSKRNMLDQQDDAIYATIAKKKERKIKHRRKYLSENRVGSLEGAPGQSSQTSSGSDGFDGTSKTPHYYEHVEAINLNAAKNYHKNKVLADTNFTVRSPDDEDLESPTEAYNKEILKALHRDNRSPGSGSIGSFLSMASVRSFPKCSVPEPLSRVLEPLSVMHLDHSDEGVDTGGAGRMPRIIEATYKRELDHSVQHPNDVQLYRSQSDGADPGVIGPVVWEIHKKQLEQRGKKSSLKTNTIILKLF